jgi:hypothetical protein
MLKGSRTRVPVAARRSNAEVVSRTRVPVAASSNTAADVHFSHNPMRVRSVFGGSGPLFDTPEDDAKAALAAKAQQDAIEAGVAKAMEKANATLNSLAAELRTLKAAVPEKKEKGPEPGSPEAKQIELDKQIGDFKTHKQRVQQRAIKTEIQTAALGLGLEKDAIADFVDLTLVRDGSKIQYDEAADTVTVKLNEVDGVVSVDAWLKARDSKGELNRYKPAKGTPKKGVNNGNGSGGADVPKVTREQLRSGKFDPKILTGKYEVVEDL